jgi:hypothetical protein
VRKKTLGLLKSIFINMINTRKMQQMSSVKEGLIFKGGKEPF